MLMELAGKQVCFDCSMSPYTTFKVGGPCEVLYTAEDVKSLRQMVAYLSQERIPYLVLGGGSNLLVTDDGLDGMVIQLKGALAEIDNERPDRLNLSVGAGLSLSALLVYCREKGLGGLEWVAGIPGTVGGAVMMNAGAFGHEFRSCIKEIEVVTSKGNLDVRTRSQLRFSYRRLDMEKGEIIVRAILETEESSSDLVRENIVHYHSKRKMTQPLEYPSAGSVFKNPPNDYAGRLIEKAGLKGKRIGGAMISDKHANFIVNTGKAAALDILNLMELAKTEVKRNTGIELEPEIHIVGKEVPKPH